MSTHEPLVCTDDDELLDVLLDWCSAVDVVPEVVRDAGLARRSWRGAPFVLIGDDVAADLAMDAPPRRRDVFVVARPDRIMPWDQAVALGAEDVLATDDRDRALAALTSAVDGGGEACVLAVVGGAGGVGASCLAAALGLEAGRRGLRVLLVDGDPMGGGLDVLLGLEYADGLRWSAASASGRGVTARSLAEALPHDGNVWVLTAGRTGADESVTGTGLLAAARRGFDLVVCDVDRHLDPLGRELLAHALLTVVVVPEEVRGLAAASTVIRRIGAHAASLAAVTARRRPGLARQTVEDALGVPVLGTVGHDRRLQEALDHGSGPGGSSALRRAALPVLELVGVA